MRWPRRKHDMRDGHIVDRGRVWCPVVRHDVDVDRCFMCSAFEDLARDGAVEVLRCRPIDALVGFEAYLIAR